MAAGYDEGFNRSMKAWGWNIKIHQWPFQGYRYLPLSPNYLLKNLIFSWSGLILPLIAKK